MAKEKLQPLGGDPLDPFEGREVVAGTIKVTNAGDGLSTALAVDPVAYHHGQKVTVVLDCEVTQVNHIESAPDADTLVRVHTFKTHNATVVDRDLVEAHLQTQADRIQKARDEAAGRMQLDLDGTPEGGVTDDEPSGGDEHDDGWTEALDGHETPVRVDDDWETPSDELAAQRARKALEDAPDRPGPESDPEVVDLESKSKPDLMAIALKLDPPIRGAAKMNKAALRAAIEAAR